MTESELVKAAQQGDTSAFERLVSHYYDTVFRFAMKWCGKREDAEDVAQLVCIKLARVLPQFRFESAFSTWLYRIVVNTAKDWQAKQQRAVAVLTTVAETGVSGQEEAAVMLYQLLEKVNGWGEGFKETLVLVHGEGLTHLEAATVLGVKESTISWRLYEIRKKLALLSNDIK